MSSSKLINKVLHLILFITIIDITTSHSNHDDNHHHCSHDYHKGECPAPTRNDVNYDNHPYDTIDLSSILSNSNSNSKSGQQSPLYDGRRSLLTDAETSPIRISAYYDPVTISTSAGLTLDQIDYIKQLVGATIDFYESFVQVIPISGALTYQSCISGDTVTNGNTTEIFCYLPGCRI